jgi:ABC-type bacteriocin/lantibiotic exporter with double-glycine peptidase domain
VTIMFFFSVKLTLISVVMIPFLFVLVRVFGPVLGKISRALTQAASDTSSTVTESIDNAETVQSFTLEEKQITKADSLWRRTYQLSKRGMFWSRGYRFTNSLLIIIGTSAVMYFGGKEALYGYSHPGTHAMTLGQLLIFMTYMGYLLGPVEELAAQIASRNQKLIDVSRIYEVLTDHEGIENLRRDNHFPISHGRIEFQNVSYAYNNDWVLKNLNLSIDPGQKIGIIGPSGSGKSTLLKLLPLFIEPTQGRIMVDNVDIQTVSLQELRQRIAWISQSPQLFNESIIENLADGDIYRQMSQAEVEQAMKVAYVDEFVNKLPMGASSTAGEGGSSLSGGQKQRIAVARGLLKKAPIVCMDEPTAALDSKSENYIRDSISKLISGKTVLMVTHRKALLGLMDKVYVMENGEFKDVNDYGGLDSYLQKITDTDASTLTELDNKRREEAEADERRQLQQRLSQLEADNTKLSQKLDIVSQQKAEAAGTLYISHRESDI